MATQHRGSADEPSPSEYHVEANPNFKPRSGEWAGKFVPKKSDKQKKAATEKFNKQMNTPYASPLQQVNAAQILREMQGKKK